MKPTSSGLVVSSPQRNQQAGASRITRQVFPWVLALSLWLLFPGLAHAQTFGCTPAMANDIVCENSKTGTPSSTWQISGTGDSSIQGFATDISVNRGQTISFKVNTNASSYRLDIYRMGYYGGNGARKIVTVNPSASLPQNQPACLTYSATKLYDCGNWAVSASWAVPADATSGIYFAQLVRPDTGGASHIFFIVRNDASHSDILFQTSDSSWQAYNDYGGNNVYGAGNWDASNRSYKVSYNRPFHTRDFESITWVFGTEYPMVRWLEANGYDVTYFTDVDSDRSGSLIQNHKVFTSNGHDEYWSKGQRTNVEAARNAGINLAFFSGNEVFWKTRWENSTDGSGTPYRTLVVYKETLAGARIDPLAPNTWTGTWRDPQFSPPGDGGRPENSLTGTIFMVNGPATDNSGLSIKVPAADGKMRFWRNTSIASLGSGSATLPKGTLGYEWDVADDNGFRPAGLFFLSTTTQNLTSSYLLDQGGVYGSGTATHHLTLYRAPSGALVFGAGTVQWAWGLDSNHDNTLGFTTPAPSADMKQATINLFADMGVQPKTIQSGLLLATKSTDATPPVSTITSPAPGANLSVGVNVTMSGTASDSGGVVGGVEVSVNSGQTWHPASGRASWTYTFKPTQMGPTTLMSRATDDTGNIETPKPGVPVNVPGAFGISGTITPTSIGNGATITLGGASSATVTANSSGNYTFSGLVNGNYTVTPSKSGYVFSPVSKAVTVNGVNVTGVSFTGSQSTGTSYSISGSVTPTANGSGVTITLTGAASASAITDSSGNFSFAGLANGNYTVTPSKVNFAFSPVQSPVTIASGNVSGVTFNASMTAETLFTTQTPTEVGQSDGASIQYELGTLIQSTIAGQITGVRFWKDSKETGTHTGRIWSTTGQLLASVTFAGESASGWQQQALSAALAITANTTYVVSVNTGASFYVSSTGGLTTQVTNGDLRSVVGGNGVYGSTGVFPTNSYQSTNYFRDIVFVPGVSYSISGSITPLAGGSGATVNLTGAATRTVTADASGNFSFAGLSNGAYTITPAKSGYAFTPASASATVTNASVTGVSFAATAVPTYSISGTITPAANGSGATVTLSGAVSATTTADSSGNYTFTGQNNGSYTVTPSKGGISFAPLNRPVTVSSVDVTGADFTASVPAGITIDATAFGDRSPAAATVVTSAFSTTSANELLLAMVGADVSTSSGTNNSVTGMTGGGLTWALVQRTNTQRGTAEIWRAFATAPLSNVTVTANLTFSAVSSMTVMSFRGVNTSGTGGSGAIGNIASGTATTGAPTASLTTIGAGSLVVGVGQDWDGAASRTVGANQTLIHQLSLANLGTFWMQQQTATTPNSGVTVTINDTAPTNHRYNLAICEILAAP